MRSKRLGNFNEYLNKEFKENPKKATLFLKYAFKDYREDGEIKFLLSAISKVVKARGVCETAKKSGLTRQGLWKALRPDNEPKISTLRAILNSLGYSITFNFNKIKRA